MQQHRRTNQSTGYRIIHDEMNFLHVCILVLLRVSLSFGSDIADEPMASKCFSRWDHEYNTIRQLAKTADKQEQLEHIINNQQQLIEDLQGSINFLQNTGYTAGRRHNDHGSGSDMICLPTDPTWSNYADGNAPRHRGYLYGTEIDDISEIFPFNVNEQDLPCVVCQSSGSSSLMIPARKDCYSGWTREYHGYLMAGYHSAHGSKNHVCVDFEPEFVPHGNTNDDESILYLVEAQCGSLPCPPYVQGRELACVICSK